MGRQSFERIGCGMDEREAADNAFDEAQRECGHQEGYSGDMNSADTWKSKCIEKPQPAKKCTVDKDVQTGARKWETVYVIDSVYRDVGSITVRGTQADAIKQAKEIALKNNQEYDIRIEKHLVGSRSRIATVMPKASKEGKWKFWGEARC